MARLHLRALLLGVLTDVGGSLVVGGFLGLAIGLFLGLSGVSSVERINAVSASWGVLAAGLLIGVAFSLLGGFVAAWIARERAILHGGMTGLVSSLLGLIFPSTALPAWYLVVCFAAAPLAGMLGGRLARRRVR